MGYAKDLEHAEQKAEATGRKAEELMDEVQKLKDLNETLVNEVNEAKKREASANLSHYAGSPSTNKKKGANKKKKKAFNKNTEGDPLVQDGSSRKNRKSVLDTVSDKLKKNRRAPEAEAGVGMGDMAGSSDHTDL